MNTILIFCIALAVISLAVKVHRGSLFFWSKKKDGQSAGRHDDNARR